MNGRICCGWSSSRDTQANQGAPIVLCKGDGDGLPSESRSDIAEMALELSRFGEGNYTLGTKVTDITRTIEYLNRMADLQSGDVSI